MYIKKFLILISIPGFLFGQINFEFGNQGDLFDKETTVAVAIPNGLENITMNVRSIGGELNSNAGDFGVGDDQIDGTDEIIILSFDHPISITAIDFGGITDANDGANLKTNSSPALDLNLSTGVVGFNGTSDIYSPQDPIILKTGETLSISGTHINAIFDLESIHFDVIPEVSSQSLKTGAVVLTLLVVSRCFN
jgi:hypothetical protein